MKSDARQMVLPTMRSKRKPEPWMAAARVLARRFDVAFPSLRMCPHYVAECHRLQKLQGVDVEELGRFMSDCLQRIRRYG